ncbi:MAG: hypothetical protein GXY76_18650 [Chloroflexi bacterium]|nr:hypothetical protein [Chloroflexota bacterium]
MAEQSRTRRSGVVGPLILIGLGLIFLGNNLGWLDWSIWTTLLRIWPVFLIAAGIDLLFGRRSTLGALAAVVLIVAVFAAALYLSWRPLSGDRLAGEELVKPLQGAARAEVTLERAAGKLEVSALQSSANLVEGTLDMRQDEKARVEYEVKDGTAILSARNEGNTVGPTVTDAGRYTWDIRLNDAVPMALDITVAAGESDLDLTKLDVEDLRISLAVGANKVILPQDGMYKADISGAVGSIEVVVPRGLAARVSFGTALVGRDLVGEWDQDGNVYTTPGYATAESRVDLNIGLALGGVKLRRE